MLLLTYQPTKKRRRRGRKRRLVAGSRERAYQVRAYPTKTQVEMLARLLGAKRFVWNWALRLKQEAWAERKENLSFTAPSKAFTAPPSWVGALVAFRAAARATPADASRPRRGVHELLRWPRKVSAAEAPKLRLSRALQPRRTTQPGDARSEGHSGRYGAEPWHRPRPTRRRWSREVQVHREPSRPPALRVSLKVTSTSSSSLSRGP